MGDARTQPVECSSVNTKVGTSTLAHDGVINSIERGGNIERQEYCTFTSVGGYVYVAEHSQQCGLGRVSTAVSRLELTEIGGRQKMWLEPSQHKLF